MALAAWLLATRPKTLAAGIAPVLAGSTLGATASGAWNWLAMGACLLGAILIQIGSNFANDAYDGLRGTDDGQRLGPARAVASGQISARAMLVATIVVLALALIPGWYLAQIAGWPLFALGLVSCLCAVAYTGGPFPLAYHGLGDLFVLIFFGWFAVLGSAWVQAAELSPWPATWWWCATALGLQAAVIIAVNNQRDHEGDRTHGKRTLAVRLGPQRHRWYIVSLHGAAVACLVAMGAWPVAVVAALAAGGHAVLIWRWQGRQLNPALGIAAAIELLTACSLIGWLLWAP